MKRYIKIPKDDGAEWKVSLDMMKLIAVCEKAGCAIDKVLKVELYDMENSNLNNDIRYEKKNRSIDIFPPHAFKTESAENEVIRNLTHQQLDYYLQGCTKLQYQRFIKNKLDGYTINQIARQEGVKPYTVKVSIARAKEYFIKNAKKR